MRPLAPSNELVCPTEVFDHADVHLRPPICTASMEYLKDCSIGGHKAQVLMKSPQTCSEAHDRACQRCWEKWLSNEVEKMQDGAVHCMSCLTPIARDDLVRLARKGTIERYDALLKGRDMDYTKYLQCPGRCIESRLEPEFGRSSRWQKHDTETDGRIFICAYCEKQTYTACDRPEHFGQTCTDYRLSTLDDEEQMLAEDASDEYLHTLPTCPECDQPYEYGGGCAYFQCGRCKYRFCGECWAPWAGPRGEYEMGRLAHREHCKFRQDDPHPDHMYRDAKETSEVEEAVAEERGSRSRAAKTAAAQKLDSCKAGSKRKRIET